jgi:hypothetical protein
MKIVGATFSADCHGRSETGEHTKRKLTPDEARQFYAELRGPVLMRMEACGSVTRATDTWSDYGQNGIWVSQPTTELVGQDDQSSSTRLSRYTQTGLWDAPQPSSSQIPSKPDMNFLMDWLR